MIDEFQDTDPVQLAVFSKIYLQAATNETTTGFTVIGDPKQAIYRFRGADIFTYLSIKDSSEQVGTKRLNIFIRYNAIIAQVPN